MRYVIPFILICALVLTACGGNSAPADNNGDDGGPVDVAQNDGEGEGQEDSDTSSQDTTIRTPTPTLEVFELEVPLPGTLVASATEDPDAGLIFDRIRLVRFNGPVGAERIEVEIFQDGNYTWNGQAGTITQAKVIEIDNALDSINFFGLQGTMLGPSTETRDYRYSITVERGSNTRTVNAQEGFYPLELDTLLVAILDIGFRPGQ